MVLVVGGIEENKVGLDVAPEEENTFIFAFQAG